MEGRNIRSERLSSQENVRGIGGVSNFVREHIKCEGRVSLFWLTIGFILLFCILSVVFWTVNAKSFNHPVNVYVLTQDSKSSSSSASSVTTTKISVQTKSIVQSTVSHVTTATPVPQCREIPDNEKFDCHPDGDITEEECLYRGCCYSNRQYSSQYSYTLPPLGVPPCYYPPNFVGYMIRKVTNTASGLSAELERVRPSGFPNDVQVLSLTVNSVDENIVRVKITDRDKERFESPIRSFKQKEVPKDQQVYDVSLSSDGVLSVRRKISGKDIFKTKLSELVYSDQFIQLSTRLPSKYIYGLGENYAPLVKSVNWTRYTFWNKDDFPAPNLNIYGTQTLYLSLEDTRNCHGVFLLNSNGMDAVLQPTPALTYRIIGGVLDFFIFFGSSPSDVVRQYTNLVGLPIMPPYWSLGFHLCRFGRVTLNETKEVLQRNQAAGVPVDVQWNDIDHMKDFTDFTYDNVTFDGLPEFVQQLHDDGLRYVLMFDPGVNYTEGYPGIYPPYDDGVKDDIFVKNNTGDIFLGKVWNPVNTVFPDFSHPKSTAYWTQQFKNFHDVIPFDGAWIDMNEVSNFHYNGTVNGCPDDVLENPKYVPGGMVPLYTKTICMTAKHYYTTHYNEHNLYGFREAIATNAAMQTVTRKRPFVIGRATFAGQGYYSGHWSGDIASSWEDMRYSIVNMLDFNIFGIPMIGTDICGFRKSTTEELCARWSALGAFYPFSRNHNDINNVDQDPAGMSELILKVAKSHLITRYTLLPFLYSLFYRSHVYGETVVRPLFFEFPHDPKTYSNDEQFLWGSSLMISPVLYPNVNSIAVYFPKGWWYNFYTGEKFVREGETISLPATYDQISLSVRGGHILPMQKANGTTTESRNNDFFLQCYLGEDYTANGELYWDDGDSVDTYENGNFNLIQFSIVYNSLSSLVLKSGYQTSMILGNIKICGLNSQPRIVMLNFEKVLFDFDSYFCLNIDTHISLLEPFRLEWN